jgi:uncharacterized membrane protein YuzA (DUF378 family)
MMDPLIIPIVGMAIPIVIVPVALGIKYARRERELEHAERMKALELGRTLPEDEPLWSPGRLCLAIGVGVPIGVFGFAWLASGRGGDQEEALRWISAAIVGLAGVVCGSLLTHRHLIQREHSRGAREGYEAKSPIDADAFDVVDRRG